MFKLLNFLSFRDKVQVIEYLGGLSLLDKPSLNKTLMREVHFLPFPRLFVCFFLLIEPSYILASTSRLERYGHTVPTYLDLSTCSL